MSANDGLPWTQPGWLATATAWIRERANLVGEIEQVHVRWWSTVLRAPTIDGDLYFKAAAPAFRFEAPLTAKLSKLQPKRVPELVDVDVDRGWLLMRDGGTRLRELLQTAAELHHWESLLPEYAQLQIDVAPHAEELLALGVPDERLSVLPERFRTLLAHRPEGLTAREYERLVAAAPELEAMCHELAGHGIPETIQHDDLHDGQIFVQDGRYLFFDWGDSCISHPFHTLAVTLRAAAAKFDLEPGGPELRRMRDAYLEPFGDLQDAAELAYRTGTIARSLAWQRYVSAAGDLADEDDRTAVAYGLKLFLAGRPIGSWREPV
jgi:hypothetical protein